MRNIRNNNRQTRSDRTQTLKMDIAEFHVSFFFLCQCSLQISFRTKNVFFAIQIPFELDVFSFNIRRKRRWNAFFRCYRSKWKLPSLHKTHWWTNKLSRFLDDQRKCQNILVTIQRNFCSKNKPFEIETEWRNAINQLSVEIGGNCQRELLPWVEKKILASLYAAAEFISCDYEAGNVFALSIFSTTLTVRKTRKIKIHIRWP